MREMISTGKPWESRVCWGLGVVAAGKFLYSSGITARDPEGNVVGVGDMRVQITQAFNNLGDVLRVAGVGFDRVIKFTMYTTDIEAFMKEAEVWQRHFIQSPASTLVEVRRLVHPDMLVEIEAVAELPE